VYKLRFFKVASTILLFCATMSVVLGQAAVSGNITGIVRDQAGSVVPGATVTARNSKTNVVTTVVTNDSGAYNIVGVIPGDYVLRIEQKGFKQVIQENVVVKVDSTTRVDGNLETGDVLESVTVSSAPPLLQTERPEISQTISAQQINNLPTVGRNISRLTILVPGASFSSGQLANHPENSTDDFRTNVNGQSYFNTNRQVDGVDNNEAVQGQAIVLPTVASLQEIKITTSNYDAEFGQVAGAVIQASTKAGTNEWHGSLFEFNRNSRFFARDPFTEPKKAAHYNWNQFGGSVGGPIKKDKLFFFFDYQGARSALGGSILATVPTLAERNGDFSALSNRIFDPNTGAADGTGRTQFLNNIIPTGRLNSAAVNLLKLIPLPTDPTKTDNNYQASAAAAYKQNQIDARVDYNYSERSKFFGRISFFDTSINAPTVFGVMGGGPSFGGLQDVGIATTKSKNIALNNTFMVTPTLVTETRFGLSLLSITELNGDGDLQTASQVGIPNINQNTVFTNGLPGFTVGGPVTGFTFGRSSLPFFEFERNIQVVSNWTKVSGNHAFKWGADIRRASARRFDKNGRGVFNFSQNTTGSPAVSGSGLGLASFLLGLPNSYSRSIATGIIREEQWRNGFFFQDNWTASPKLTVTLGLRYEYFSPIFSKKDGGVTNFDPNTGNVLIGNIFSKYVGVNPDRNNFSPRIGIAYRLREQTVLRAGFGRSYAINALGATFGTQASFWPNQDSFAVSAANTFAPIFSLTTGPPAPTSTPALPASGLLPLPNNISYVFPGVGDYPYTYVDSWNATIQQRLGDKWSFEAAYVGNRGRDIWYGVDINLPVPGAGTVNPRRPYFVKYGLTQSLLQRRGIAESSYHALQAKLERSFSNGLSLLSSFTYSHAIDWGGTSPQNPFNFESNRGNSGTNRPLTSVTAITYELPIGHGKTFASGARGVADKLIGGWNLNAIINLQSGLWITPVLSDTSSLNSPGVTLRPDRVGAGTLSNPTRDLWFDPTAFVRPANFVYGNSGRAIIAGPGIAITDFSVFKTIRFGESKALDLRGEFFNLFNRTNLGNPNATIGSSTVGRITSLSQPMRRMQFGVQFKF
jgi:outer membrane receptor protein involved in Fe transport